MSTPPEKAASALTPPGAKADRRSSFDLGELASVCAHYDVGDIRRVLEYRKGSRRSPKVLLDTSTGRYLLKRRARGRDDPYRVAFCHDLQLYLAASGFPATRLIGTRLGNNSMVQLGDRVYELFEYVEGEPFDRTATPCEHAGALLARLHALARDYHPRWPAPAWSYHDDQAVRVRLGQIVDRGIAAPEAGELRRVYDAAAALAAPPKGRKRPRVQLLHGDWHPGNMIFRDRRVAAVVDFDGARTGPVAPDVATGALQFALTRVGLDADAWPDALDAERFAAFLRGYGSAGEAVDPKLLPPLMTESLIAEVAAPVALTGSFGGLPPDPFVRMVLRKSRWLLRHADKLAALGARSLVHPGPAH
ncbi:MAG TPA: phosphotransferase [Phycisphaerales bacterium]|nr:phosphotransferase [Phycisphaerales bacterium]